MAQQSTFDLGQFGEGAAYKQSMCRGLFLTASSRSSSWRSACIGKHWLGWSDQPGQIWAAASSCTSALQLMQFPADCQRGCKIRYPELLMRISSEPKLHGERLGSSLCKCAS